LFELVVGYFSIVKDETNLVAVSFGGFVERSHGFNPCRPHHLAFGLSDAGVSTTPGRINDAPSRAVRWRTCSMIAFCALPAVVPQPQGLASTGVAHRSLPIPERESFRSGFRRSESRTRTQGNVPVVELFHVHRQRCNALHHPFTSASSALSQSRHENSAVKVPPPPSVEP
jgi:hypothetical protein